MKNVTSYLSFVLFLLCYTCVTGQDTSITESDKDKIVGSWEGSLTYLDYSSNKPYSMPCNAHISLNKKRDKLNFQYIYPNEPKANRKFKMKISNDGTKLGKESITSKTMDDEGNTILYIETEGKDGNENKRATIRETYSVSDTKFIIRKEVKFKDSDEWLLRNEYNFNKVSQ